MVNEYDDDILLTAGVRRAPGEVDDAAGDAEMREAGEEVADDGDRVGAIARRLGNAVRLDTALVQVHRHHLHDRQHARLKSFLFCKSSLPQPFLFLIQVSLYGFLILFTVTSEHIVFLLFSFSVFTLF